MHRPNILIAGAGISGLSTAISLAKANRTVEIYDAAPDSGWSRKETWDAVENWTSETDFVDLLEDWNIHCNFEYRPIFNFELYDPRGNYHPITTSRPLFYLVKRGSNPGALERALKLQALESGAMIHYSERRNPQEVDIWAVGAQHRGQFLSVGIRFLTTHADTVKLLISAAHAPKAYSYLFVNQGQGVLAVILTRNFSMARTYLQRCREFFLRIDPMEMENVHFTSGFGGRNADFWRIADMPLRVGEAAGFQDYLWGFGIRYALLSGYLAAHAISHGTDYNQAIRTQIHPLVYTSLLNRAVYNRSDDHIYHFLIDWFSSAPELGDLLRSRYRLSIPKQLLWLARQAHTNVALLGGTR